MPPKMTHIKFCSSKLAPFSQHRMDKRRTYVTDEFDPNIDPPPKETNFDVWAEVKLMANDFHNFCAHKTIVKYTYSP